jgi:adenylate cyclase
MIFASAPVIRSLLAAVAILLVAILEWWPASWTSRDFGDEWLRDRFIRLRATNAPETRLAMVDIDEASLARLGPWPWPRSRIADLVENLLGPYQASGVALDLVFPERADADGDLRLAMLAQHGPVVLAQAFDYAIQPQPLRVGHLNGGRPDSAAKGIPTATGFIANHDGLAVARHVGNIGFVPDEDGTIRRLPPLTRFGGKVYPMLTKELFDCCSHADAGRTSVASGGFARVPYSRNWSAYTIVPAEAVLQMQVPPSAIAGRVVVIGSSSLGLTDRVATPLTPSTSGMLVHASMLSYLFDVHDGRVPAAWPGRLIATGFVLVVALLLVLTLPRLSAIVNVTLLAAASGLWLLVAYSAAPHDPSFSTTAPLLSILFLLSVSIPFDWQLTQRKSHRLLGTLRQYVAKSVVDELLRLDLKDPLTPQQLHITTLIADMQGYTGQVESLNMNEAANLTRDFLDCLTRPVLDMHGTLDKFTGDGLVAFWGAPLPQADHADLALDAAEEITKQVRRFSEARQREGKPPLRVRIGIESGLAMAGDFGSAFRSIYTAVGDSVNVASRLEQLAREYPHDIIVGQGTVACSRRHRFKHLGDRMLRGKEYPTTLYTLESAA